MENTKKFPARVVLTVTTDRLLTAPRGNRDNGISDLYEILGWMTNDSPFTHQLPRFCDECKPWLLRWFPELAKADALLGELDMALSGAKLEGFFEKQKNHLINGWLDRVALDCGLKADYDVPRIPQDDHDFKDPYDELVAMRGTDEGIVLVGVTDAM